MSSLQPEEDPPYIAGASTAEGIWRQQLDSFDFLEMLAASVKNVKGNFIWVCIIV